MLPAQPSPHFQSLTLLPTSKLGPSGADSWVGGFVYILGPVGLSNELSCELGSFSSHHNAHRFLQPEVLRLSFPCTGTLGCMVYLAPQLFLLVYPHADVGTPTAASPTQSSSYSLPCVLSCRAAGLCPSYQSG